MAFDRIFFPKNYRQVETWGPSRGSKWYREKREGGGVKRAQLLTGSCNCPQCKVAQDFIRRNKARVRGEERKEKRWLTTGFTKICIV